MDIEAGAKVVHIDQNQSPIILEVLRTFKSGKGIKVRVKNNATGSECPLRISEIRLATKNELDAGYRIDRDESELREQFKYWFCKQSFLQSFAHGLGDRTFDHDVIKGKTVYRNTHLDAVWQAWLKGQIEVSELTNALLKQAELLAKLDAELRQIKADLGGQ